MSDPRDPLSDEALASAFRAARTPVGLHLSEADWERLTCDELHGESLARALSHIASCGDCTAIHRALLDLREQATRLESGAPPAPRRSGSRWSMAAGLAAAAALVAAVLINQPARTTLAPADATRAGDTREAIAVVSPAAGAALEGRRFEWRPINGATTYEIRVHTGDGARVFSTRSSATSAELPADLRLTAGAYFWQVVALRDEAIVAASAMIPFRVN